jgi:hypothetical protein
MNNQGIVLTIDLLDQGLSVNGAYNYDQLHTLGVEIPLKKGWRRELVGKRVSSEAVDRFLALKDAHIPAEKRAKEIVHEEIIEAECRNCHFWEFWSDDKGYCHRFPHKVTKDGDDWCGEFKATGR